MTKDSSIVAISYAGSASHIILIFALITNDIVLKESNVIIQTVTKISLIWTWKVWSKKI